ncbi:hypothetical protein GQ457_02G020460 [Hibiscus cannabinus]
MVLKKASKGSGLIDTVKWSRDTSGCYKPKSYCVAIQSEDIISVKVWKLIWRNLAPPKVETFVWKVAHGRVSTCSELVKRGINCVNSLLCVLCGKESEIVEHLLCHSTSLGFYGLIWTIWSTRNEIIFSYKTFRETQIFELTINRIGLLKQCKIPNALQSRKKRGSWVAPPAGYFKFNVDASVSGSYGATGIGGILRNHVGLPLFKFVESIGFSDPTRAELKAIHKACLICFYVQSGKMKAR